MIRLHQRCPCKAKSIMRPSINQYSCATVRFERMRLWGSGWGVQGFRAWNMGMDLATGGVEGDALLARLGAFGMAVVVKAGAHGRRRWREALPEAARRLAGDPMHGGMKNDPRQFAGAKSGVAPFEPLEFVSHALGHPQLP